MDTKTIPLDRLETDLRGTLQASSPNGRPVCAAAANLQVLFPNYADQQAAPVGGHFEQRSNSHQRIIATTQVHRGAAHAKSVRCVPDLDLLGATKLGHELQVEKIGEL